MISRRGLGNFVGEPREMGTGPEVGSGWHMTVQAMSFVRAKYLEFGKFFRICSKFPEVEADGRARKAFSGRDLHIPPHPIPQVSAKAYTIDLILQASQQSLQC